MFPHHGDSGGAASGDASEGTNPVSAMPESKGVRPPPSGPPPELVASSSQAQTPIPAETQMLPNPTSRITLIVHSSSTIGTSRFDHHVERDDHTLDVAGVRMHPMLEHTGKEQEEAVFWFASDTRRSSE